MKTITWLLTMMVTATASSTRTASFDSSPPGRLPTGWVSVSTPAGAAPKWEVVREPTAPSPPNVLVQVSNRADSQPLAVLESLRLADGEISVRFKPIGTSEEQLAGVVWRYRDPNNYYMARADALDHSVLVYRIAGGRATLLRPLGRTAQIHARYNPPPGQWGTLKVVFRGSRFGIYVNHRRVLEFYDTTISGSGKVGLCSGPGSAAYFDDFRVSTR